ncbi:hypothetical protein WP8W19C03_27840 [Aeromonas veronii]|uniref:hypothetical protein n=1 Tax=Aeromonas TaxID=642 RepID=UPI0007BC5EB5|nr:hypothetical protein [Aeromonas veronii]KZW95439.1 hypothetical protein WM54_14155 [Aeromonas veronii]BBT96090.1 hypothetical protein WP8W19C03_27840 [Aeromonas veronii]
MRSKAFHDFESKVGYFDDDIDLVEVVRLGIINGDLTDNSSSYVLKNIDPVIHKHIKRRKNSNGSRELLANHLRQTVYSSYVKDIYEEVTLYLKTILENAAENGFDSGRIIGEHSTKIDAKTILAAGSWREVAHVITDSVFQSLESEKSTLKLLEKISNKLALGVNDNLINDALPYLEVRHFLVHTDGKIPEKFKRDNPHISIKAGHVKLDYEFVSDMRDKVKRLIKEYDEKVVSANLLKQEHLRN